MNYKMLVAIIILLETLGPTFARFLEGGLKALTVEDLAAIVAERKQSVENWKDS